MNIGNIAPPLPYPGRDAAQVPTQRDASGERGQSQRERPAASPRQARSDNRESGIAAPASGHQIDLVA